MKVKAILISVLLSNIDLELGIQDNFKIHLGLLLNDKEEVPRTGSDF